MKTILTLLLLTGAAIAQMPQTITTYSSTSWPVTTTISPNGNGGYNWSRIGNGGSGWGGVTAAPGTTVSAVVGSRGQIVPIITPNATQVTQPTAIELATIDAPAYGLIHPKVQRNTPAPKVTKDYPKEIPAPAAYNNSPYGQYAWLHNQLTSAAMKQLAIDWRKDSGSKVGAMHDPKVLLAYLRIWVRSHPGCLTGNVALPVATTSQK
jgi:hypothetical protein